MTNKTILQKAQTRDMRELRPFNRGRPSVTHEFSVETQPHEARPYVEDFQKKYRMQLGVFVEFWSTDAGFPQAEEVAEKTLMHEVYGDIRSMIHRLRLEIHNENHDEAMRLLQEIEGLME